MAARRGIRDRQRESFVGRLAVLERAARDAGQLVPGRQAHAERAQLALQHGEIDQRHHPHVGVAQRDERHHLGERPQFTRRRRRRAVAHRPRDLDRRPRIERGLDDRASICRCAPRDETGRQPHVGLIAGEIERGARGARLRHRQHERGAAWSERQRRAPLERQRERAGPGNQRRVRGAISDERQRTAAGGCVDQRRARDQVDAADAAAQRVAVHGEHAACGVAVDAHTKVGAGQRPQPPAPSSAPAVAGWRDRSVGCIRRA